ncbi:MAG: hypothetical protein JWN39_3896, partial [Ilumatobacteraceae bacterium]|nr:hypothetical protein [Ilumatobacteraceae bacterium]
MTDQHVPTHHAGTFSVIGGGNMGAALAGGLISSNWIAPGDLAIVEVIEPLRARLVE